MKYVLDASVALKWVLLEKDSNKARALRDDFKAQVHDLLAPDIFPVECAHGLAKLERRKLIPVGQSVVLFADIMSTPPVLYPTLPLLARGLEIANSVRMGVYDCLYVALGERENCEVVTADLPLVKNLQSQFPFIKPL
jgi:predicted nucleic acid-binding protein